MIQNRESTIRVRACESRVHPVFNQSSGGFILHHAHMAAVKKKDNAANFFVSLKQNNSEGFIGAP